MFEINIDFYMLAVGALAGTICVLGLWVGIHNLTRASQIEDTSDPSRQRLFLTGGLALFGQLVVAAGILYWAQRSIEGTIWLGVGLVFSIFISVGALSWLRR